MELWGFLWVMVALKLPLVALLWLVWWAVRAEPEPEGRSDDDDGGIRGPHQRRPQPPDPRRRGPHGDPVVPAPPRTRTVVRSRERAER